MRKIIIFVLLLSINASGQSYKKYVERYAPIAVEEMQRTGIPASITLAQAILESGAGRTTLAQKANNHFGIKCHTDWEGETTSHDDDAPNECFRVYPSAEASFRDHSDFLCNRSRYKGLFDLPKDDYQAWARGLKAAGYATDPQYAEKLIRLIEDNDLASYDKLKAISEEPQAETKTLAKAKKRPVSEIIQISFKRDVYMQDGRAFIISREGETYSQIAERYNLFLRELLRFNGLREDTPIPAGTKIYLERARKHHSK